MKEPWSGELLCVTHSDRPVDLDRCDLNFLQARYENANRLPPSEPFEALRPSIESSPHLGAITVWAFPGGVLGKPRLLAHLRPETYKAQHAIWYRDRLWILGVEVLEVYDANLERVAAVSDPWLSGAHTILPGPGDTLAISCSASDSVLLLDPEGLEVVQALRMPESLYGSNYDLARSDSVVDHYIDNDKQLTHINCATEWRGGVLVSSLIQGAIGWFGPTGQYSELVRGYVGCHGARADEDGQIYFADSSIGTAVFLTDRLTPRWRVDAHSRWLHDVQMLSGGGLALAVADRNTVEIVDSSSGSVHTVLDGSKFGQSTQFLWFGQ